MLIREARIDLHCHTRISDNSLGIREVIELASRQGVTHLAITDHDTTKGLMEAMRIGGELGVEIIPGIEISGYDYERGKRAHFLGLYVEPGHSALDAICGPMIEQRHNASYRMVQQLIENGYRITWKRVEEIAAGGSGVYKQHIMQALIEKDYCNEFYGDLYKKLFARAGKGKVAGLAYVLLNYINALDAINAIHSAGGIAVLAHPGQFDNYAAIPEWADKGLDGIEAWHPLHNELDVIKAKELADEFGLLLTGGSDFHGEYGDPIHVPGYIHIEASYLDAIIKCKFEKLA